MCNIILSMDDNGADFFKYPPHPALNELGLKFK